MNTAKQVYTRFWRGTIVVASLTVLAYVLYFHQLGTLLPAYSPAEIASYKASSDWHLILNNPINAPFKVPVWLGTAILHHGIIVTRYVAASWGIVAVLLFFLIARLRYRYWIALTGTVLFATSAGFLHAARLGSGLVLQLGVLVFIWCILRYRARYDYRTFFGYIAALLLGLLFYIPGMVWFMLFGLILLNGGIRRQLREIATGHLVGWAVSFFAVIAPLIYAIARKPSLALDVAGLPHALHTLTQYPQNLLHTLLDIGIRSDANPLLWVDHVPLLNVIEFALIIIGIYMYIYRIRHTRSLSSIFLIGTTVLALLVASFGGSATIVILIPLIYLLIVSGLNNLLGQWLTVFPRNPIARSTGIVLVGVMLFFSVLYQVRSYFVAWPHNSDTRHSFERTIKP